jgi:predicted nuclease of predicted toxin-antitoxin system
LTCEVSGGHAASPALAIWLRRQGHDAVHAADLGLSRVSDSVLLTRAKPEGRTIITADLDYPRLLAVASATEPSLILFRDGNWSDADVVERMGMVLHALTAEDLAHSIVVVDRDRVRRRRLPIKS